MRVVGVKQLVSFYTQDVIISVGYRVKSKRQAPCTGPKGIMWILHWDRSSTYVRHQNAGR